MLFRQVHAALNEVQAFAAAKGQCIHPPKVYPDCTSDKAIFGRSGLSEFISYHPPRFITPVTGSLWMISAMSESIELVWTHYFLKKSHHTGNLRWNKGHTIVSSHYITFSSEIILENGKRCSAAAMKATGMTLNS
jgi:hypothetical protein